MSPKRKKPPDLDGLRNDISQPVPVCTGGKFIGKTGEFSSLQIALRALFGKTALVRPLQLVGNYGRGDCQNPPMSG